MSLFQRPRSGAQLRKRSLNCYPSCSFISRLLQNIFLCRNHSAHTPMEIYRFSAANRKHNILEHLAGTHFNGQKSFRSAHNLVVALRGNGQSVTGRIKPTFKPSCLAVSITLLRFLRQFRSYDKEFRIFIIKQLIAAFLFFNLLIFFPIC